MYLTRLPSDPRRVVDLTKVSLIECRESGYSGPVIFSTDRGHTAELDVTVEVGWFVALRVDGETIPWSGTEHDSEQDALKEMHALADKVSWGKETQGGFEDAR